MAHDVFFPGIEYVRRVNRVEYYAVVVGVAQAEPLRYFLPIADSDARDTTTSFDAQLDLCLKAPFVPIEGGASLELLEGLADGEELRAAQDAFRTVRRWAGRYADRIVADLYAFAIRRLLVAGLETVCLVSGPVTTKIAGRLGYLYLPPEVTVAIVYTAPEDLMTSILSQETGLFEFDISHLRDESDSGDLAGFGPYPGNLDDSMIQTYFLRPPQHGSRPPLPVRIDLLAQGITERVLAEKRALVERLFTDRQRIVQLPILGGLQEETYVLPRLLDDARKHAKRFIGALQSGLG